jgi:uncharacterized protein YccT (UPF0319 family)
MIKEMWELIVDTVHFVILAFLGVVNDLLAKFAHVVVLSHEWVDLLGVDGSNRCNCKSTEHLE